MDTDFYAVTTQIAVVLLLAATIESKVTKLDLTEKSLYGFVARLVQLQIFIWGVVALFVGLVHLSGFTAEWFTLGKLTVFISIFTMLLLLATSHMLSLTSNQLSKQGVASLGFLVAPMLVGVLVQYAEIFTTAYIDVIFINVLSMMIFAVSFIILFRNKKYLIQLRQIIGVEPINLSDQEKLLKPTKRPKSS